MRERIRPSRCSLRSSVSWRSLPAAASSAAMLAVRLASTGQSEPSSSSTIWARSFAGDRSSSERIVRCSAHVASLYSTTTTLTDGRLIRSRAACSSRHCGGRASGRGRSMGTCEQEIERKSSGLRATILRVSVRTQLLRDCTGSG
eukprot:4414131-Prymnesium_polylepis.1